MTKIVGVFEPSLKFAIEEASGEVDGQHIIGKIRGEFFVPNGTSRNGRHYKRGLWEKVCADQSLKQKMAERRMFGTISHKQPIDDTALLEGKLSHTVTSLSIDEEGRGIGEALIFNTPAGRNLNTLLRGGAKLFTSSRANGEFKGTYKGVPVVDEDSYKLETFDIVIDPGFLQANPTIAESLENFDETFIHDEVSMANENVKPNLTEALSSENLSLRGDLSGALAKVNEANEQLAKLTAENSELKKVADKAAKLESQVAEYKLLGTPEEINKVFKAVEQREATYKSLGTVEEIEEALDKGKEAILAYQALGTPKEIKEAFDVSMNVLGEYKKFGSVRELDTTMTVVEKMMETIKTDKRAAKVEALSAELGVEKSIVESVYGKLSEDEIRNLHKAVAKKPVTESKNSQKPAAKPTAQERFQKPATKTVTESKENKDKSKDEFNRKFGKSLGASLIETFGGMRNDENK